MTLEIINGSQGHVDPCLDIARGLRTHFNDNAMEKMPVDLREHDLYVAEEDDGQVVGFLTVLRRSPDVGEVSWMGVRTDQWRRGIGTALSTVPGNNKCVAKTSSGALKLAVHTKKISSRKMTSIIGVIFTSKRPPFSL